MNPVSGMNKQPVTKDELYAAMIRRVSPEFEPMIRQLLNESWMDVEQPREVIASLRTLCGCEQNLRVKWPLSPRICIALHGNDNCFHSAAPSSDFPDPSASDERIRVFVLDRSVRSRVLYREYR